MNHTHLFCNLDSLLGNLHAEVSPFPTTVEVELPGTPVEQVSVSSRVEAMEKTVNVYVGKKLSKSILVPDGYGLTKWTMKDGLALLYIDPVVDEVFVDRSES